MSAAAVRIFIGSGEQSVLERKVLIYSLRKHTKRELDIRVFNGTHNAIEHPNRPPAPAPLSLQLKYRNLTEFSLYRYLIPQLCSFRGKALYLDSDMVCLSDIGELYDTALEDSDFLAKRDAYSHVGEKMWALSVLLIDCTRCRFDLDHIFAEMDEGCFRYVDFSQMSTKFLSFHPFTIGELDPHWNVFDRYDTETKLIHYTNLFTQPWKFPNHPYERVWFSHLREALHAGYVTQQDIDLAILRGYARPDLCAAKRSGSAGAVMTRLKRWITRLQGL